MSGVFGLKTLEEMFKIYKPDKTDWMNEEFSSENPLVCLVCNFDGNFFTSLLSIESIDKLATLMVSNEDLYNEWMWLFYAIYECETKPLRAHKEMMAELQEETKKFLKNKELTLM